MLHDGIVFVQRPEIQRPGALSHVSGLGAGINWQIIKRYCIVKYRHNHIHDSIQICVGISCCNLFILPRSDICGLNLIDWLVFEIWQDPILENVLFTVHSVLSEPVANILNVNIIKCLKCHVRRSLQVLQE